MTPEYALAVLGVEKLVDYTGTMQDAKSAIEISLANREDE